MYYYIAPLTSIAAIYTPKRVTDSAYHDRQSADAMVRQVCENLKNNECVGGSFLTPDDFTVYALSELREGSRLPY